MSKPDKPNGSQAGLERANSDGASTMPEAFAGMYQTGHNNGYTSGQEAGFRQGFEEGYAAAHKGPNGAAVTVAEGKNSAETWAAADAHFVIRSGVNNS